MAISLSPRSPRMQYGLELTHELMEEIEKLSTMYGAQFMSFVSGKYLSGDDALRNDGVHVLNGKYYRTSSAQYQANVEEMNRGLRFMVVPVTVSQWRVGPENPHLNERATDQVMKDFARQIEALIPARR